MGFQCNWRRLSMRGDLVFFEQLQKWTNRPQQPLGASARPAATQNNTLCWWSLNVDVIIKAARSIKPQARRRILSSPLDAVMCDLQQAAPLRRLRIPIKEIFILCDAPITFMNRLFKKIKNMSRWMFVPLTCTAAELVTTCTRNAPIIGRVIIY